MSLKFLAINFLLTFTVFSQELPMLPSYLSEPGDVAIDSNDNIFITDCASHIVFKISKLTSASIVAGAPNVPGYQDGPASGSKFKSPCAIGIDSQNNIIVGDTRNSVIRKISQLSHNVSTIAGSYNVFGHKDNTGKSAVFNGIWGLTLDGNDSIYVAEAFNHDVRLISSQGVVTTVAGVPFGPGTEDGPAGVGKLYGPNGIALDKTSYMFTADANSGLIKRISPVGKVKTIVSHDPTGAVGNFKMPLGLTFDKLGNIFIADFADNTIKKISANGEFSVFAGIPGAMGFRDGQSKQALFCSPSGIAVDSLNNIIVTDTFNRLIRKITPDGVVSTIFGTPPKSGDECAKNKNNSNTFKLLTQLPSTPKTSTNAPSAISPRPTQVQAPVVSNAPSIVYSGHFFAVDNKNNLFTTTIGLHSIKKISTDQIELTIAGDSKKDGAIDAKSIMAKFKNPAGIVFDDSSNLYLADSGNNIIRKITPTFEVTTFAGTSGQNGIRDGNGTAAKFNSPTAMTIDRHNILYLTDTNNHTIRKISPNGDVTTYAGLPGEAGLTNDKKSESRFFRPSGIAIDSKSQIYVSDTGNNVIRLISTNGRVSTFAGTANEEGFINNNLVNSKFNKPKGLFVDENDNLYIADSGNHIVRKISTNGIMEIVAGIPNEPGSNDGDLKNARLNTPISVTMDKLGNLYIADSGNDCIRKVGKDRQVTTVKSPPPADKTK